MLIRVDLKGKEVEVNEKVCPFHKKNPGKFYAGCTCSTTYAQITKKKVNK